MKRLLGIFICFLFVNTVFAQQDSISIDEHNKFIVYNVVSVPGVSADSLFARGLSFMEAAYPKDILSLKKKDLFLRTLMGKGRFLLSRKALQMSHEESELQYTLKIEVKDQKFRYWLSDFLFVPYQRNRYNTFEPVPGILIPLEALSRHSGKKTLARVLESTLLNSLQTGNTLLYYMQNISALRPGKEPKKINTSNW